MSQQAAEGKESGGSREAYKAEGGGGEDVAGEDLSERWRTRDAEGTAKSEEFLIMLSETRERVLRIF